MSADVFLDTNVLVYAFDKSAPAKRETALRLLSEANWQISWQVIQEFSNVALHRFSEPLKSGDLADYIDLILWPRCTVLPTQSLFHNALSLSGQTQYQFYDSLIVASALASGADRLLSEDLQDGRTFGSMKIENPFRLAA